MSNEAKVTDDKQVDEKVADEKGSEQGNDGKGSETKTESEKRMEELEKANSSKDAKIAEYQRKLKELERQGFNKKTDEEKLSEYELKIKAFEQREAFTKAFRENNLDPEVFADIVNEAQYDVQAQKFNTMLSEKIKIASEKAVEDFKLKELEKIKKGITKNRESGTTDANAEINGNIRAAFGKN